MSNQTNELSTQIDIFVQSQNDAEYEMPEVYRYHDWLLSTATKQLSADLESLIKKK